MYICLCNSLKDKDIKSAIDNGASRTSDVYKQLGCKPECCKCVPYVKQNIADKNALNTVISQ